ncbi:MAG: right-handed parallel beta-helix repeat-containing protein, partial [Candidatus Competibacteraceae bacterium]|nr:right-handed parallel beta-helix repeat-containing protein [Candidatus Competibacteraceae bacterium]
MESPPSNTIIIDYVNTLPRAQGGTINQNTVWTPGNGDPYVISSTLQVSVGATFTLQPGTKVKFNNGNGLQVDGTLVVRGTAAQPVTFTSGQAAPAAGNWPGIQINGAATNVTIDYAVVEYAAVGILFNDNARGAVGHSTVRSSTIGVRFNAGSGGTLVSSAVRNNWYGVQFYPASTGALTGNTIRDNAYYGVQVAAKATPRITGGNEITANNHGLYVAGDGVAANNPAPVVTGNSLYGNAGYNYYATSFGAPATTVLDATGNWWGSADPGAIAAKIYDYSDYPSGSPTVNFSGYLNGPGGAPVGGSTLQGTFASSATLVAGVYTALGGLYVPSGVTLTLEAGATLRFPGNFGLTVDGTLVVRGTAAQPVTFTSGQAAPAAATGRASRSTVRPPTSRSTTRSSSTPPSAFCSTTTPAARSATARSAAARSGCASTRAAAARSPAARSGTNWYGVQFYPASTGALTGNTIRDNAYYGVQVAAKATPRITGGNEITANNHGLYVAGDGVAANNPAPVVTGNSLYGNAGYNYYATSFGA